MNPDPASDSAVEIDLGEALPPPEANGVHAPPPPAPPPVALASRRADIDIKQAQIAWLLEQAECEAALLLGSANVAWFTAGMNVRGLIADSERPGTEDLDRCARSPARYGERRSRAAESSG